MQCTLLICKDQAIALLALPWAKMLLPSFTMKITHYSYDKLKQETIGGYVTLRALRFSRPHRADIIAQNRDVKLKRLTFHSGCPRLILTGFDSECLWFRFPGGRIKIKAAISASVTSEIGSRSNALKALKTGLRWRTLPHGRPMRERMRDEQHLCVLMKCFCVNPESRCRLCCSCARSCESRVRAWVRSTAFLPLLHNEPL